jgi:predicted CXXCH cytochrome family protein
MKRYLVLIFISFAFLVAHAQDEPVNKCLECHKKLNEPKEVHQAIDKCENCHQSNGKQHPLEDVEGFTLIKQVPDLCFTCHEQSEIKKEHMHPPVKDGDCLACHNPHSSKNLYLLSAPVPGLCFSCHNDMKSNYEAAAVKHTPVLEGKSCRTCHFPHSSDEKKLMVKAQPDLCFTCHDKAITVGDRVIPDMKTLVTTSKTVHGAIDNNGCSVCHNPHASDNKFLLAKAFPTGNYSAASKEIYNLCMDCHEATLFTDSATTESTGFRDKERNLHFVHVNKAKGRTCINCHDVHASNNLYLIADKVKFGKWDMPMKFNKLPKGGSCAPGCHTEKKYER